MKTALWFFMSRTIGARYSYCNSTSTPMEISTSEGWYRAGSFSGGRLSNSRDWHRSCSFSGEHAHSRRRWHFKEGM